MPKFRKGQKRPAGAGRKLGSKNKITRSVKDAFACAFGELQTDPRTELVAWAKKNRTNLREFYKIAARFIPLETTIAPGVPPPVDLSDRYEVARRLAFLLGEGMRARGQQQTAEPKRPELLPAPPPFRDLMPAEEVRSGHPGASEPELKDINEPHEPPGRGLPKAGQGPVWYPGSREERGR